MDENDMKLKSLVKDEKVLAQCTFVKGEKERILPMWVELVDNEKPKAKQLVKESSVSSNKEVI